jgi:type IV pilus assembly protein PilA
MLKQMQERRGSDEGFTLIELLIAIVVVGVLSTVVILGIGGLKDGGEKSTCKVSVDAVKAASAVYFANTGGFPTTFTALTGATPPILELSTGITPAAATLTNGTWTVTIGGGGAAANTFTATPAAYASCTA